MAYVEIRVRELTSKGTWPWRYVVEGLRTPFWRKAWPWSKPVLVTDEWVTLPHGEFGSLALQEHDAHALARHYRTTEGA